MRLLLFFSSTDRWDLIEPPLLTLPRAHMHFTSCDQKYIIEKRRGERDYCPQCYGPQTGGMRGAVRSSLHLSVSQMKMQRYWTKTRWAPFYSSAKRKRIALVILHHVYHCCTQRTCCMPLRYRFIGSSNAPLCGVDRPVWVLPPPPLLHSINVSA